MRRSSPVATGCFLGLLILIVLLGKAGQKWQDFVHGDLNAHRPDSTLIANFRIHRPELERLVEMAQKEKPRHPGGGILIDMGWKDVDGLSQARWGNYKHLFRQIGAKGGIQRSPDGAVQITMSTRGALTYGEYKGFYYSPTPPAPIVFSLDSLPRATEGAYYRHLEGPWYLFYRWGG